MLVRIVGCTVMFMVVAPVMLMVGMVWLLCTVTVRVIEAITNERY